MAMKKTLNPSASTRTTNRIRVNICLEEDLRQSLDELARDNRTSRSDMIKILVMNQLERNRLK